MYGDRTISTDRLFLTPFAPEHTDALFEMNSDPDVMRYLGGVQTRDETTEGIARVQRRWSAYGHGWWTVFLKGTNTVAGAACLQFLDHQENTPLEVGWRLKTQYHGNGYATEAGKAAMDFGFDRICTDYICAVAEQANTASQRVMERLGMTYVGIQTHYNTACTVYETYKNRRP